MRTGFLPHGSWPLRRLGLNFGDDMTPWRGYFLAIEPELSQQIIRGELDFNKAVSMVDETVIIVENAILRMIDEQII